MASQLPNEIFFKIFESLCFHCKNPGKFPNADTEDVREDKATLARLCRVSPRFRSMAQPILYHYYATGNCKHFLPRGVAYYEVPGDNDHLLSFATTLTKRPDLAAEVMSMQLVNHPGGHMEYHENENVAALKDLLAWSDSHGALSVSMLNEPLDKWCANTNLPADWKSHAHRWVMSLAMVLAVKVKDVVIAIDDDEDQDHQDHQAFLELGVIDRPPKLLALRTLGTMSWGANPYHLATMRGLLRAAPNLETIFAVDTCDSLWWNQPSPWDFKTYAALPKVKKVVINNLYPRHLGRFLARTSGLEELEYYWQIFPQSFTELYAHICPVKDTLKRLTVSFLPWPACDLGSQPWFWYDFVDAKVRQIESLADFPLLEDVTIDYRSLYREDDVDEADRLTRFLPTGIRRLRIAYVVVGMTEALRELAGATEHTFTKLESVTIGVPKWPDGTPDHVVAMRWMVEPLFRGQGIRFVVVEDNLGPQVHTVLPGATKSGLTLLPWKEEVVEEVVEEEEAAAEGSEGAEGSE
ncbi:hypothetical protein PG991_003735 [Apiospora marii]|uniref:F-box domain-containing protein n=1 Tax=Apiospora marii TaxID=335849 RepID=A0ABR1S4D4_9PEZI